jgi:transcriptional regulator with XRE-family HTH domain
LYFIVEAVVTGRGPYKPRRVVKKPQTLGERLVVVRRALGFSQATLATAVGVPQQSISSWERGLTEPSGPGMRMLTTALGVTAVALKTGKGFSIPDAPPPQEGRAIQPHGAEGGYVAVEDGTRKAIELPAAAPGEVWGVDAASGQNVPLTKEQALAWLTDAIDNAAPVWIVSKPDVKVKRARATTGKRSKT